MTFSRGAAFTTAASLGHSDSSDLGPTDGNGFATRWDHDFELLAGSGIRDVRLPFDWARLQPRSGHLDAAWVETYHRFLTSAATSGLRVWATLHEDAVPRWVDDEGGLDSTDTAVRWWPHWVERVAGHFGDDIAGWVPFAELPASLPLRLWQDTWGILGGGSAPVVASLAADRCRSAAAAVEMCDIVGIVIDPLADVDPAEPPRVGIHEALVERYGDQLHRAADDAHRDRFIVSRLSVTEHDGGDSGPNRAAEIAADLVGAIVAAADAAVIDGIGLETVFVEPAVGGAQQTGALLDAQRSPLPALERFVQDDRPGQVRPR